MGWASLHPLGTAPRPPQDLGHRRGRACELQFTLQVSCKDRLRPSASPHHAWGGDHVSSRLAGIRT